MKILLATAEVNPFAKTGGLADVTAALPAEWIKLGHSPIIILPKYMDLDIKYSRFKPLHKVIHVPMSNWMEYGSLWEGTLPNSDVPVYLIENHDYFSGRHGIYGDPQEFADNDRRFIFFSRAVLEAAKALNFQPDIIHAHDFHTAFTLAFLKSHYADDPFFAKTGSVFTIHNLAYQGWWDPQRVMDFANIGMENFFPGAWTEHNGSVNAMKTGIMFADKITTVSPSYSKEIRMPHFSEGLQDVLNERGADLIGVLNGVDYQEWNPETDENLYVNYSQDFFQGKKDNKIKLLQSFGFTENDDLDMPLLGMITRLAEQKGIDLLMDKLEDYLYHSHFRLILLGSGQRDYEDYFRYLQWKYPGRIIVSIGYNTKLSHRIFSAADYLLVPSRFEPCGLTQLYALKYGTIPIVRATGGLADTVKEYVPDSGKGHGFVFWQYNSDDMAFAIKRALSVYSSEEHWDKIRKNAMNQNFSSSKSALQYLNVFKWALEKIV